MNEQEKKKVYYVIGEKIETYEVLSEVMTESHNRQYEPYQTNFYILGNIGVSDSLINTPKIIQTDIVCNKDNYYSYTSRLRDVFWTDDINIAKTWIEDKKDYRVEKIIDEVKNMSYDRIKNIKDLITKLN